MYACLVISFGYFAKNAFDSSKSSRDAVLPLPMVRSFQSKRRISLLPAPVLTTVKLVPMPLFLTKVRRREKARRISDGYALEETYFRCLWPIEKFCWLVIFHGREKDPRKITISTAAKRRFCILHRFHGTLGGDVPRTQTRSVEERQCISRDESISASACSKIFSFIWHKYDRYAGAIIQGATVYYAIWNLCHRPNREAVKYIMCCGCRNIRIVFIPVRV